MRRKKILDRMSMEDLVFTFQNGDYKFVFEYDTPEEFAEYMKIFKENVNLSEMDVQKEVKSFERVQKIIKKEAEIEAEISRGERKPKKENFTFFDLESKFILSKRKLDKVSESTYKAYEATFTKLKDFFKYERIENLSLEDFENFRDDLAKKVVNKTVNNHLAYVKMFISWGHNRKLFPENNVQGVENLADSTPEVEPKNYTDKEIREI